MFLSTVKKEKKKMKLCPKKFINISSATLYLIVFVSFIDKKTNFSNESEIVAGRYEKR